MSDREEQMAEAYAAIGRYTVEFEQLVHALRLWATFLLTGAGLKNQGMAQAIVNSRAMNVQSLRALLQSFLAETEFYSKDRDPDAAKIIDHLFKLIGDRIEERNKILHGTWYIGWGNEGTTDWSMMSGFKGNPRKTSGVHADDLSTTPCELLKSCEEVQRLTQLIHRMLAVTGMPSTNSGIAANFWFDGDQLVGTRPPSD
jgi:hypothetical protein